MSLNYVLIGPAALDTSAHLILSQPFQVDMLISNLQMREPKLREIQSLPK